MINKKAAFSFIVIALMFFSTCGIAHSKRIAIQYQGDEYYANKGLKKANFNNFSIWLPEKLVAGNVIFDKSGNRKIFSNIEVLNKIKDYPNPKYLLYVGKSEFLPENYDKLMERDANGSRNVFNSEFKLGNRTVYFSESFWASNIVLNDGGLRIYSVVSEPYSLIVQIEIAYTFDYDIKDIISSIQFSKKNQQVIEFDSEAIFKLNSANYR